MTKSSGVVAQPETSPMQLSESTLNYIEDLLIQKEEDGAIRGLYSPESMPAIRECLTDLALWLSQNKPAFMAEENGGYTRYDRFSEKTALCISYVDHIRTQEDDAPAVRLQKFYNTHLSSIYSHLHILPHFKSPLIHENVKGPAARADGGFEAKSFKM
ncbi:MAG: hypothetical protein ACPG05_05110, partial [Bdellovibrionales bacterium]